MSTQLNFEQNPIGGGRVITEKVNVDVLMLDIYLGFMGKHCLFLVNLCNFENLLINEFARVFLSDTERMLVINFKSLNLTKYYLRDQGKKRT